MKLSFNLPVLFFLAITGWALSTLTAPSQTSPPPIANPAAKIDLDDWKAQLPFSFKYGGKDSATFLSTWQRGEDETNTSPGGQIHRYSFTDPATKLKVVAEVRTFTDYPAIDWVLRFTNGGDKDTPIIEDVEPLHWTTPAPSSYPVIHHARGSLADVHDFEPLTEPFGPGQTVTFGSVDGRSSDRNTLPIFNLQLDDHGIIGAVGWTGNWSALFDYGKDTKIVTMTAGMQKTHFTLHAGESVRTPRILLLNWSGGDWEAAQNTWRRFALAYYSPVDESGHVKPVPFCLGTWGAEPADSKLAIIQSLHDAKVPFDVYWIDAGWYGDEVCHQGANPDLGVQWFHYRGTWTPNATTYPNGFKPIGDALKEAGIQFLLWFEPETADPGSSLFTNHPDWLLETPHPVNEGQRLLNLGNPDARKGITDIVSKIITDGGLQWYRQDFNMPISPFWELVDSPDRVGITEMKYIEGLYAYWDDLRRRHPGLQIDNCSSGGRRLDIEMMSRSVSLWRTDYECGFFDPIGGQLETQGLAPWVPLNAGNYGGVAPGTPNDGASLIYAMRSNYSAGFVLNPGDRGAPGALANELMKSVGEDFLSVRPYFTGDFYALNPYNTGTEAWAAWQFDRHDLKAGVALLFRRQDSIYTTVQPSLHAIDPNAQYDVEIRTGFEKGAIKTMSGQDLDHLSVDITDKPGSALVFYKQK